VDRLPHLIAQLHDRSVRFVMIGVAGANYYALSGSTIFTTRDWDLFLPPDPDTLLQAWDACEAAALTLWIGGEPLESPRDRWLAERIAANRATVRATDAAGFDVDMTLVMAGFDFEAVWRERRVFQDAGTEIAVARLTHIIASKHAAGREKDRLFLATHRAALEELLRNDD
jgi:hypothetical protein